MKFSSRSSAHFTGLPSRSAAAAAAATSGAGVPFDPKAPPTSGRITRIAPGSSPSACASPLRVRCTSCAETQATRPSPSGSASTPRGSIGAATMRGTACRALTTCAAAAKAPSTSPPECSKRSSASGAAPGSTTASSGS